MTSIWNRICITAALTGTFYLAACTTTGPTYSVPVGAAIVASITSTVKVKTEVATVAAEFGIDVATFETMARIESNFRADAINPVTHACGVFQFMPATAKQYGLTDCLNAEANIRAAAVLLLDNQKAFVRALGRLPSPGEAYLMHQQGAHGAIRLIENSAEKAAAIVGEAAVSENGGGPDLTAAQFARLWTKRFPA